MSSIIEQELDESYNPKEELPIEILKDEENYKFLEGTINLKDKEKSDYIKLITDKDATKGRIFLDNNKKEKYIEIFTNKKMNILGISQNITFLHSFSKEEKRNYNSNKFIGFRYYENKEKKAGKYFTLIKKNYAQYFILEKDKNINDINNNTFYDEDLNCYKIIYNIMINKYKNKIIGDNGETFPEIIGYCSALTTLNNKYFKFVGPLVADINIKNRLVDFIPEKIMDKYIYIEPFIYDGHVSLIISANSQKSVRYNIILDMSHYHFKRNNPNLIFLPKSLKEKNIIYPQTSIQEYSSCCLWLFGEIECILKYEKYWSFKSIFYSLKNGIDFYIDIINLLSNEIEGKSSIIRKENDRFNDKTINKIDLDRIFSQQYEQYYSLHKDIVNTKFLNIEKLFLDLGLFLGAIKFLTRCQDKVSSLYELKNQLDLNLKYYDFLEKTDDIIEGKSKISKLSESISALIKDFNKDYDIAFYQENIFSYVGEIWNVTDKIEKLNIEMKKKILDFQFDNFMKETYHYYLLEKNNIEKTIRLFSYETISRDINSLNNIFFSVMNK